MAIMLMAASAVANAVVCARFGKCSDGVTRSKHRQIFSNVGWDFYPLPLSTSPLITFNDAAHVQMAQDIMDYYAGIDGSLPSDYVQTTVGFWQGKFIWDFVDQSVITTAFDRPSIGVAGTHSDLNAPDYPCEIKATTILFARNPTDAGGAYCWGDYYSLNAQCGPDRTLDFISLATHEFGHAMGLDHSDEPTAVMYPQTSGGTVKRSLIQCEVLYLQDRYSDNFGPSDLEAFAVVPDGDSVRCTWRTSVEIKCHKFRLTRVCPDGVAALVGELPALGAGTTYALADAPDCTSGSLYRLAEVDSLSDSLFTEEVIAERGVGASGWQQLYRPPVLTSLRRHSRTLGADSPQSAVEQLGQAITGRDLTGKHDLLADGFMYYCSNGTFWSGTIESILQERLNACLSSESGSVDSLAFEPTETSTVSDNEVVVTAHARYIHRCSDDDPVDWDGQIVAIVERRSADSGWRIRQIVEQY